MENRSYVKRPLSGPAALGSLYEIFAPLLGRLSCLRSVPIIFILCAAFPFHKIHRRLHRFIASSNLWHVGNDLTLDDPFYLQF